MKNLHIIPTDKPSRLFKVSDEFKLTRKFDLYNGAIYQHIYITNDEEIKEGDWIYYTSAIGYCKTTVGSKGLEQEGIPAKKIILTTDPDLIKDGVQAIDDEFLEWFVKNPSCELVEVKLIKYSENYPELEGGYREEWVYYEIILPKEELKQDPLEEAAKEYSERHLDVSGNLGKYLVKAVFQDGGKWEQEQDKNKYSEEEAGELAYNIIGEYGKHYGIMIDGEKLNELFEKFKKK